MEGYFLALEGPDGSGKTTIASLLKEFVESKGRQCILTREPGGTKIGEEIRKILLTKDNSEMSPRTEALLYAASRAQHVDEKIRPELELGKVVISDRFIFSSLAYQGFSRNLGLKEIMELNKFATNCTYPDRIIFFDIDPVLALERKFVDGQGDRLEREGNDFHQKVFLGYEQAIKMFPQRVVRIDAGQNIENVYQKCVEIIKEDIL